MGHVRQTVICFATWFLPLAVEAQAVATAFIRGKVLADDLNPVNGAIVRLSGRTESVRTSDAGEFQFAHVAVGAATLQISAIGYIQKRVGIRVASDSGWVGSVVLARVAQRLPDVDVSATGGKYDDFFRRRKLGFGTFRTWEDFEKMGATDIVSVLQGIPGVNVSASDNPYGEPELRFRMARCPGQPPNLGIYVNGKRVALFGKNSENKGSELSGAFRNTDEEQSSTCKDCAKMAEVLSSLPLLDVMFVEFYRGPGQIPNDLDRGDSCAALVLWTR